MNTIRQTEHNARRLATIRREIARLDAEREQIIRYLAAQGASLRDIAEIDGRGHSTIRRILTRKDS